jgi:hypothetical protein
MRIVSETPISETTIAEQCPSTQDHAANSPEWELSAAQRQGPQCGGRRGDRVHQSAAGLIRNSSSLTSYKTIILPLVLYGCETWSLTLREEHRLRVFENRVLRRIFGPKRVEVKGEWRKLHNEELRDLYSSPGIIRIIKPRRMRWAGHVARMGRKGTLIDYWWESQRERDH